MSELIPAILNSKALPMALTALVLYGAAVWLAAVIWVAKDLSTRTHRIDFLALGVLMNVTLPGLGFILYLFLRPQKTLIQQHFQSVEKRLIREYQLSMAECPQCDESLSKAFLYCPNCSHHLRKECSDCVEHIPVAYKSCPFCGVRQQERQHRQLRSIKNQSQVQQKPHQELPSSTRTEEVKSATGTVI